MTAEADAPGGSTPEGSGATATMVAIVQDVYGADPDAVLRMSGVATPCVGADEVLVRVRAASVDRGTWHLMAGLPYPIRPAASGLRRPRALNPGRCIAGTVVAVGASVVDHRPGDEIYGTCDGAFAEYARAEPSRIAPKPRGLSFEEAAAMPVSAQTALQAVRDKAGVEEDERVLIIGASGGVGTFAVQIAKAYGAFVTGVCSTSKMELVRSLGADVVIDYADGDITAAAGPNDCILDIGGNRSLKELRRMLAPGGTLLIVGGETDGRWLGGVDRQLRATVLSLFVRHKLGTFIASENHDDLEALSAMVEAGTLRSVIDHNYPLAETPAAIRHVQEGRARGKVVVSV